MKLAVIGCGYVGNTIADALENAQNDVVRIDPKYNDNKLEIGRAHVRTPVTA